MHPTGLRGQVEQSDCPVTNALTADVSDGVYYSPEELE